MTVDELCEDMPAHLRTRIVNALHAEGVDTVADLDAFLDANGFTLKNGRLYRFPRLRWIVPNLGMRSWKAIRQAAQDKAPHVLDEAKR